MLAPMIAPGIAVERGVPMPPPDGRAGKCGRKRLYQWSLLEVGDSFVAPTSRVLQASLHWAGTNGRTFTSRKTTKGHRVWRTA